LSSLRNTLSRVVPVLLPLLLAAAWSVTARARAAGEFLVPRETIVAKVHTIGVMPLVASARVPDPDPVAVRYEEEIAKRLEHAGFAVVRAGVMRDIRERLKVDYTIRTTANLLKTRSRLSRTTRRMNTLPAPRSTRFCASASWP
jgi:hypothetical protein